MMNQQRFFQPKAFCFLLASFLLLSGLLAQETETADAAEGTLRKLYASSIGENSVHGSDSPASAAREVSWFFKGSEVTS